MLDKIHNITDDSSFDNSIVSVDMLTNNLRKIEQHSGFTRIAMIKGSSTNDAIIYPDLTFAQGKSGLLVDLDSLNKIKFYGNLSFTPRL